MQFEYAWCLVRRKYIEDVHRDAVLLEELLAKGRDLVFFLAVGSDLLKEYKTP